MAGFKVSASRVVQGFKATLRRVEDGNPAVIFDRRKIVGVLISPDDYRFLRRMRKARQDARDLADAREAMKEEGPIPWEDIKAELGL